MSLYEGRIKSARRTLEKERKKQADEEKKAAKADANATRYEREATRATSRSGIDQKLRFAQRKRDDANRARQAAAKASAAVAKAQADLHAAEGKLAAQQAQAAKNQQRRTQQEERRADRLRQAKERERERQLEELRARDAQLEQRLDRAPWTGAPETITVLFIAASPEDADPLRLDREFREIQQRVRSSEYRDRLHVEVRLATQVVDLLQMLNETKPHVVHFSGHGSHSGLAFEDADGNAKTLSNGDLGMLLHASSDRIRLAVFNSCDSAEQAILASEHVDAAIGMNQSIDDEAAKVFAGQLYSALGFGKSLLQAFDQAQFQVKAALDSTSGEPRLYTAEGIDAGSVYLVAPRVGEPG